MQGMTGERKVITLCGSTKFKKEYELAERWLTDAGYVVLTVGCFNHADNLQLDHEKKEAFDLLHKDKILNSDEILIINVEGYMGISTVNEHSFAIKIGVEVWYWAGVKIHPVIRQHQEDYVENTIDD